jgi:hypothetical protein
MSPHISRLPSVKYLTVESQTPPPPQQKLQMMPEVKDSVRHANMAAKRAKPHA